MYSEVHYIIPLQNIFSSSTKVQRRSFIKRQTSSTSSDNEWQRVVQRVTTSSTTSDNEYNEWQQMTTSGTTSDNEWYNEWQRMTTSGTTNGNDWRQMTTRDNEWQRVSILASFPFFQIWEEVTTKHPKENSLNIEEDLWRRPIELRAEARP